MRRVKAVLGLSSIWVLLLVASPAVARAAPTAPTETAASPLFAYYYLWFDPRSWNRAKTDYPLLGRYSSEDPRILRQHVEWAKSAGIDGFIVSWKPTATNDRRLRLLMTIAKEADFKLAIIYQGLDFDRNPQPVQKVAEDFKTFHDQFASDPVFFRLGGKPLTIWSGTWMYSHDEIATVTAGVRGSMLVLSTEKNVEGYQRVADVTDGDAYYWSSVNPSTQPGYGRKLEEMADTIHRDGKYWVAPFAPGFDARLLGGSRAVDRKDGETLRTQYGTALRSSPDVLGLISWNEFSENTHVEPSEQHGSKYLDVLRELRNTPPPSPMSGADSSDEGAQPQTWQVRWINLLLLAGFPLLLAGGVALAAHQRHRPKHRAGAVAARR